MKKYIKPETTSIEVKYERLLCASIPESGDSAGFGDDVNETD